MVTGGTLLRFGVSEFVHFGASYSKKIGGYMNFFVAQNLENPAPNPLLESDQAPVTFTYAIVLIFSFR
jgi:hypothetical protein